MDVRATRAFLGAFGAGASLAMAASVALLLVSSVIAFKGWPDDLDGASAPEVAHLSDAQVSPASAPAVALPAATVVAPPAAGDARARPSRALPGAVRPSSSSAPSEGETSSLSTAPDRAGAPDAPAGADPAPRVGDVVRGTTETVAEVAAPTVGGALESVGAAGAGALERVGDTADTAVGTVLP